MSWIIETNHQLEYDIDKHGPDWITDGHWYNTSICPEFHGTVFEKYIKKQELPDILLCVLFVHTRNNIHHLLIMITVVVVMHYHQIRQKKH